MNRVHNVSQWPNLRHLGEPLWGAEGLLQAVSFKKATEIMGIGRVANDRYRSEFTEFQSAGMQRYSVGSFVMK